MSFFDKECVLEIPDIRPDGFLGSFYAFGKKSSCNFRWIVKRAYRRCKHVDKIFKHFIAFKPVSFDNILNVGLFEQIG